LVFEEISIKLDFVGNRRELRDESQWYLRGGAFARAARMFSHVNPVERSNLYRGIELALDIHNFVLGVCQSDRIFTVLPQKRQSIFVSNHERIESRNSF
jgi:hypothetical protein